MYSVIADFERPPVIEVAASVQFAPLKGATSGNWGAFWKSLGSNWPNTADAPRIADQEERFTKRPWFPPRTVFQFGPADAYPGSRLQIKNQAGDRMIQIQDTRFVLNWVKQEGNYPQYHQLRQEFADEFSRFSDYCGQAGLGNISCNQWELTYVNHIPAGELWQEPADWHRVLPGLICPPLETAKFEAMSGEWRSEISPKLGRLHIVVRCQESRMPESVEPVLFVQLTARGAINEELSLLDGMDKGHDSIVSTFLAITSLHSQSHWIRK